MQTTATTTEYSGMQSLGKKKRNQKPKTVTVNKETETQKPIIKENTESLIKNQSATDSKKSVPNGELRLYGVISDQIDMELLPGKGVWDIVEPYISDALRKGGDNKYSTLDIRNFIKSRDMQLWITFDNSRELYACAVTQIISYPNEKRLLLVVVAGKDIQYWFDQHKLIDEWAKKQGCRAVEVYGRKGWERLHKQRNSGYEMIHTVLRRVL